MKAIVLTALILALPGGLLLYWLCRPLTPEDYRRRRVRAMFPDRRFSNKS